MKIITVEGRAAAKFDFTKAEKRFSGELRCIDGSSRLTIIDHDRAIRPVLRQIKDAPAEFIDGTGKHLNGSASYVRAGDDAMAFTIPKLNCGFLRR